MKVILASASPRRKELLSREGIKYEVIVSDADESTSEQDPGKASEEIAMSKARAVYEKLRADESASYEEYLIISADTTVVLDGEVMGKPKSEEDAFRMLSSLSGRAHEVITGVGIIRFTKGMEEDFSEESFHEVTKVYVLPLTKEEILQYIATKEPMDKAGSYAIQGIFGKYIDRFEGDYDNVVGLPVKSLLEHMKGENYGRV